MTVLNVRHTAFLTAYYRGVESQRDDALFVDPFAKQLAGSQGQKLAKELGMCDMAAKVIAVRTRIIDDYIQNAIDEGIDRIVNLGAGLDTRPWRMDLPQDLLWIETDYPEMIRYKTLRLARQTPSCKVEVLGLDLENQKELRSFLDLVIDGNVLVLTEGIISYLGTDDVAFLADSLHQYSRVRYWIVDYLSSDVTPARFPRYPYKFNPGDWHAFFERHGWVPHQLHYLPEKAEELGRALELESQNSKLVGFALLKRLR